MRTWTISSVDAADAGVAEWYATDVLAPVVTARDDVHRAWLLETTPHADEVGPSLPRLLAVYESEDLDTADAAYLPDAAEWSAAPGATSAARVAIREVLVDFWIPTAEPGPWWASVRIDPSPGQHVVDDWRRFDDWYTFRHVGETVVAPGFHEGWRLGAELRPSSPATSHDHFNWAMYELTAPEDMMIHVNKAPLQAIWSEFVDQTTFGRTYHRVVARA